MNCFKKLLVASLALAASVFATERVYMAPFSMVGLNEDFGVAAEKLMNAYIDDNGRFVLINYAEDDSVKVGDRESANNIAIKKNCTKFIMTFSPAWAKMSLQHSSSTTSITKPRSGATASRQKTPMILTRLSSVSHAISAQRTRLPTMTTSIPSPNRKPRTRERKA